MRTACECFLMICTLYSKICCYIITKHIKFSK